MGWKAILVSAVSAFLLSAVTICANEKAPSHAGESKPGPFHERMAKLAGEYAFVTKFRMQPDAAPQESNGTATLSMQLDGRFLREENSGEMLGQRYTGLRIYGYNSDAKRFEGVWMYTGSLGIMNLVGKSDDDGKTVHWDAVAEVTANGKMQFEVITRVVDDDHFVVELIAKLPNGQKGPSFESTYTRKK